VFPVPEHLALGVAAFAVTLGLRAFTVNRLVKRKLRLSLLLLIGYLAISAFLFERPDLSPHTAEQLRSFARLALAAALINALVFALINPLREDRIPEGFPTILQDFIVIALVLGVAMVLSAELVTTSAVSAVVLGFALQDTLGNAFAGLAIQSERPFHVGQWITVGDFEGRITEVTWRATKLRTKSGNLVVLPNNFVAKEPVVNYSEPVGPTRLIVEVGAAYEAPPNAVKAALAEAVQHSPLVLTSPAPEIELLAFADSAITYRVQFWITDFEDDDRARDQLRTSIYYALQRHGIEIPWPISVEYSRPWPQPDVDGRTRKIAGVLSHTDLLAPLSTDLREEIAAGCRLVTFGSGEAIVRQGQPGQSMFVVVSGAVRVVLEPAREEVARIDAGGYFGEMSLLTGEPRSATVLADGDTTVIELSAELFRRLGTTHPAAIEQVAVQTVTRRAELERVRTAATGVATVETTTLLARMKKFLRLA
jgi:small-conductance mechanosensitive channel